MNILAIDTTTNNMLVGIKNGNKLYKNEPVNTHKHLEHLMVEVDKLFDSSSLNLDNIDVVAVVVGPGSFTGIRVGIATALGLCNRRDYKKVGVNSLDLLAYIINRQPSDSFTICIPSTLSKYYVADYQGGSRLGDISVLSIDEINERASISGRKVYALGGNNNYIKLDYTIEDLIEYVENESRWGRFTDLEPCYVSLSQAERELLIKEGKDGD